MTELNMDLIHAWDDATVGERLSRINHDLLAGDYGISGGYITVDELLDLWRLIYKAYGLDPKAELYADTGLQPA